MVKDQSKEIDVSPTENPNILIVDGKPDSLLTLENLLEHPDLNIIKATTSNEALELLRECDLALVLLNARMKGMNGYEIADLIQGIERTKDIPIILITEISKKREHVFKSYEYGVVDYLFKPLDQDILKSKVNVFIELYKQKKSFDRTSKELKETVAELKKANQKILEQQKAVIEEERLKVLLQMAGATVHELNQPLTVLLGNIQLMEINKDDPDHVAQHMKKISEAGNRIANIIKNIQTIRHGDFKYYNDESSIINIDRELKILSVEDKEADFKAISSFLKDQNRIKLFRARSLEDAVCTLDNTRFDIVFLDYVLSDGSGMDLLRTINENGIEVPVVVITGQGDELIASQVIQAGAYDYLPKANISNKSLSRVISNTLEKHRLKKEIKMAVEKMAEMSTIDELTGLYNRRYFMEALERELAGAKRYKKELVLCMMDLDHFKKVNDTYGHPTGDMVLEQIASMLKQSVRQSDITCRYGGEEFAAILTDTNINAARTLCERFSKMVAKKQFEYGTSTFHITISMGISYYSKDLEQSCEEMIKLADKALYRAKNKGRNRVMESII